MLTFRRLACCAVLALTVTTSAGNAQDFDAGISAYEAGDFVAALREWTPLAEQGNAGAQYNLGYMYAHGRGVPQDDAEAVKWFRLSAEQGDASAQLNLGIMYTHGRRVPQDNIAAHMWVNIAGANGSADITKTATGTRDKLTARMTSADVSEAQRRARVCMETSYTDCEY